MNAVAALAADIHDDLEPERAALGASEAGILDMQVAIARIHSPTFGERARGEWVATQLERAGWRVDVDAAGNVVAGTGGGAPPTVAVCAHLDTVYASDDHPEPVREGTRVRAPGICDNGRGLAALIALGRVLRGRAGTGSIELVATTGEEGRGDLRGAKHYVATRAPLSVIALDGAGDERIVNAALGSRRFRIAFHGPGGHSWSSFGVANPVHAAARCASGIASSPRPAGTSLTVSRIGGGSAVNAIPQDAWIEVDARGLRETDLAALERQILAMTEASVREENTRRTGGDALRHELARIGYRACGVTAPGTPLVEAAVAATRLVGARPELSCASTDANAAIAAGIPAIAIGAGGRGGDVHSSQEWFDAAGSLRGVQRALTLVATAARVATVD